MKRMLSSRLTLFWQLLFPLFWSSSIGLGCLYFWTHTVDATGKPIPPATKWIFLVFWIVGSLFLLWLALPLKRVWRDEHNLYVSSLRCETTIPLANIVAVRENRKVHFGGKHPIIVEFGTPTLFGAQIVFLPTGAAPLSWPWKPRLHPVTVELQELIQLPTP